MPIFAQRTTFRSSVQFPDFRVPTEPNPGDVLVYDPEIKAFKACPQSSLITGSGGGGGGGGGGGTITGAINVGSGAEVFKDVVVPNLRFRTLLDSPGITISEGADEIQFFNDVITDACISVPDSFKLEIDNDNTTIDSAKFEIFTNGANASVIFNPLTYDAPIFDITVVADTGFVNPGQFISATQDWDALGYEVGMCLKVTGTGEQDGIWEIASIDTTTNTNDTLTITVPFPDATDAGQQPPVKFEGLFFKIVDPLTLVAQDHDFALDGFVAGQSITILGTTANDGTYTIDSIGTTVTANDTIVLNAVGGSFPAPSGCDVAIISISGPIAGSTSTGWWVNELGEMNAQSTTICGDLDVICGGNVNIDGDLTIGGDTLQDIINNSFPQYPDNGIIVQTGVGTFAGREILVGNGLTVVNGDGIAGDPTIDVDDFIITITGDGSAAGTVTDLSDVALNLTLATIAAPGTYDQVTIDAKGRVVSGANFSYQPLDADLTALAGGVGVGYIVWDGSTYVNRSLDGAVNEIEITDDDASAGNSIIGLADNPVLPGTAYVRLPTGSDLQRPVLATDGMIRFNTTLGVFEGYISGVWEPFVSGSVSTGFLPLTGGVMTGNIIMNDNDLVFTTGLVDGRDVSADGTVLDNINTGTGIKVQTAPDTFVNREIEAETGSGMVVNDGDGVAGNPTVDYDMTLVPNLGVGVQVDENNDYLLIHDTSVGEERKVTPRQLNNRDAFRYFMVQI